MSNELPRTPKLGEWKVREVWEGNTGRIEPEFDPSWSALAQLRWHAAVESMRSGLRISVQYGTSWTNGVMDIDSYGVSAPGVGFGGRDSRSARLLIEGIGAGASSARYVMERSFA